jgi:penicillin amidase
MKRLGRILGVLGLVLLIIVILAGLFAGYTITRSWPQTTGTIRAAGLRGTVEILRDANGIPHIYADNVHDLFFAQGFVHAQDRFWQMDFWRHTTAGRLSELVGASQVGTDKFLRTIGWRRVAEQEYAQADAEIKAVLDAYAAGVNAYLGSRTYADLGLEYSLLALNGFDPNRRPEPWSPADSLAWGKAMAWDLGGNMDDEIYRANLYQLLGAERAEEFLVDPPRDHPVILPSPAVGGLRLDTLRARIAEARALFGSGFGDERRGIGSNNWVIGGARTETGMPLLANDPHLGIQMPAIWYLVGLHCRTITPDCPYNVAGYSLAGDPGIIIGHNYRIAWGVTNVNPDVQDLFIEKLNPANPNQYEVNGQWVDMTLVNETINVLNGEPVAITVRYTRNGPILDEVYDSGDLIANNVTVNDVRLDRSYALALRWTALEPGRVFRSVIRLNRARNWSEFREALRDWTVPSQNFVYADVDGNIGYQMPSNVPIRRQGDGTRPVPGWTDDYQWAGYIPFEELPFAFNPPQGYIATANQPVVGPEYPYLITATGFDMGYRGRRINELIEADPQISIEDMARIQGDNKNLGAMEVLPFLFNLSFDDPELARAQAALRGWDFQMALDSQPAAIYAAFHAALTRNTFYDELPEDLRPGAGDETWVRFRNLVADRQNAWWDDVSTPAVEGRDDILRKSLADGVAYLKERLGESPESWTWGRLHTSTFNNRVFGSAAWPAPIRALFNRGPFETAGGTSIVNATGYNIQRPDPFAVTSLPSMRMIVDVTDFDRTRVIHTTGQSGHPYHAHYIDFAEKWRRIEFVTLPFSEAAVRAAARETLTLRP